MFDWKAKTHVVPGALTDWLAAGETISTYTVTVSAGLVLDSAQEVDGAVTAWISAGTVGLDNIAACKIVTSLGRTDERTIWLHVVER